ncbi:MAG: hypothetical protein E7301_11205 [Butyrivibrio sp.]|nr:hypothetical protein [Butyrivibrio sp.]
MYRLRRISLIVRGAIMLISAFILIFAMDGYIVLIHLLAITLAFSGIGNIYYYVTMARHMVEGRMILYKGLIMLDFGIFSYAMSDIPRYYILLYLLGIHLFSGVVEILRAIEAKRYGATAWWLKLVHGIVNFVLVFVCVRFIRNLNTVTILYAVGLIYSGITQIATATRKTKVVYIQ